MITARQAVKACILAQYLTRGLLPVIVFRYYRARKFVYIEAGYEEKIRIKVFEDGEFIYVR